MPHNPTSAVEFNAEKRSQNALSLADFPKWGRAWDKIESPTRKAFQMIAQLSGARPGELSQLKWADVLPRERCFVIRGARADNDVHVPISAAMARSSSALLTRLAPTIRKACTFFPLVLTAILSNSMRTGHRRKVWLCGGRGAQSLPTAEWMSF
jgi:integrase